MTDRTFVYVDGESHFIRSKCAWENIHGVEASLDRLRLVGHADDSLVLVDSTAKVFWTRKMNPGVSRTYYFSSLVGSDTALHQIKAKLRDFDLEPVIELEKKQLADRRQNSLKNEFLIEKPKGVDIALAVRMLVDSERLFDVCHLYTSDVDFVPVIEAIRANGKRVFVHGYKHILSPTSPFFHACDHFFDLEKMLRDQCELMNSEEPKVENA